jgi:FtsH-binding integral membrane protein
MSRGFEAEVRNGASPIKISIEEDFAYNNNVSSAATLIRMGFLRKVYGILTIQLLCTSIVSCLFMFNEGAKAFLQSNQWLVLISAISVFGVLAALHLNRRNYPANYILLATFTILESITLAFVVTFYDQSLVLEAFLLTMSVTFCLTMYATQTKTDYSQCGAGLVVCLWLLILAPILQILFHSGTYDLFVSLGGTAVFSMFIVYDTQMIMHKVSPEEYISATIELYLDIINLFIYILRILKETRRN